MNSTDQEMFEAYEKASESLKQINEKIKEDFESWSKYVETLRRGFTSAEKLNIENVIPEVIFRDGVEYQINVEPTDDRVYFEEAGEQTIANMVFRELEIARARQNWNTEDSFEEFSDLEDDEDELDRTAFEKAWLSMEKDRQREFYEEFIKGQVPPKRKTESASEAPAGEAQSQDSPTSAAPEPPLDS